MVLDLLSRISSVINSQTIRRLQNSLALANLPILRVKKDLKDL